MDKNNVGIIAGSFSPPHKGHFNIVKKAINEIDNCSKFIISVASGTRDGITQDDSYNIWNIYKKYLPSFVEIIKGKSIKDVYDYSKEHLDENIYFVLGYREDNEDDLKDLEKRTKNVNEKYPNIQILKVTTGNEDKNISGTYARSVSNDINKLSKLLPPELNPEEIKYIFDLISPKNINEGLNNEVPYDYKHHIVGLTKYAIDKGMNVIPVPKVIFKNNEEENSKNFLGKTAYYDPTNNSIVLFTLGRDPIAIVNSYSHELIHHIQNLENRLNNINTTNTLDNEYLEEIEREAYENGGMLFRNYKDSIRQSQDLFENMIVNEFDINFNKLEKELDDILEPLGLDAEFTKHFKERCIERNLDEEDVVNLIEKVVDKYTDELANIHKGDNKVFTDVRRLVDIAAVGGSYGDDYLKDLIFKTAYKRQSPQEPEFRTNSSSPKLKVTEDKFGLNMFMKELVNEIVDDKPKYKIFCDADGVLSDFDNNFKKYSGGIPPGEYEEKMGKEAFWNLIDVKIGQKFWAEMPWMNDGHELWNFIKQYKPIILSAPSRNPVSSKGKKEWVKSELPGTKLILAFADEKQKYSEENSILIDDMKKNIEQWVSQGGIGILHVSASNTINKLKELGL